MERAMYVDPEDKSRVEFLMAVQALFIQDLTTSCPGSGNYVSAFYFPWIRGSTASFIVFPTHLPLQRLMDA